MIYSTGGIYYSSNGGTTWAPSNAPTAVSNWRGIASSANGKYLAACTIGIESYYDRIIIEIYATITTTTITATTTAAFIIIIITTTIIIIIIIIT